jgi:hypothetical protein
MLLRAAVLRLRMLSIPWGFTGLVVSGDVEVEHDDGGGMEQDAAAEEVGGEGDKSGEEEEEEEEWWWLWPLSMALFMSVSVWSAASGPELPPANST